MPGGPPAIHDVLRRSETDAKFAAFLSHPWVIFSVLLFEFFFVSLYFGTDDPVAQFEGSQYLKEDSKVRLFSEGSIF